MAYKFKRWRIRWNPQKRRFVKKKRDRQKSLKAHRRWRSNKGKMKAAMRKSKVRRKLTMKRNKAKGIYKKLKIARNRWKNILKSDINLDNVTNLIFEADEHINPVIDIDHTDIMEIRAALRQIRDTVEFEDDEERTEFEETLDDAIERLKEYDSVSDIGEDDEEFLEDLISMIEEFGEEAGILDDDDEEVEELKDET